MLVSAFSCFDLCLMPSLSLEFWMQKSSVFKLYIDCNAFQAFEIDISETYYLYYSNS